jgi:DNA invertase Pin-like site-specific DNA recombinase
MVVGYARTSTSDQNAGLTVQVRDLRTVGADKI